jgi:O-antigen/teichoic acid export membrane protein
VDSIKRSLAASLLARGVTVVVLLLTPPLFLHFGDSVLLGSWLVLIAIPSSLSLFDIGIPHIAGSYMAINYSAKNYHKYWEIFWTSISYSLFSIPILSATIYLLRGQLVKITIHQFDPLLLAAAIAVLVAFSQLMATVMGALRARGQVSVAQLIDAVSRVVELGAVTGALVLHGDLISCILAVIAVRAVNIGVSYAYLFMGDRSGAVRKPCASLSAFRELLVPSATYAMSGAGQLLYFQAPVILLASHAGAAASAAYNSMRTMSRFAPQILLPLLDTMRPQISFAFGVAAHERLCLIYSRALQVVLWSCVIGGVFLAIFGEPIFVRWTLHKIPYDRTLFYLMLLSCVFYGIGQVSLLYLASVARHKTLSIVSFAAIGLSIMAATALGPSPHTIAAALLAADIVIACAGCALVLKNGAPGMGEAMLGVLKPPYWLLAEAIDMAKAKLRSFDHNAA